MKSLCVGVWILIYLYLLLSLSVICEPAFILAKNHQLIKENKSVVTYWWTQRDCGRSLCGTVVERELNTAGNSADM